MIAKFRCVSYVYGQGLEDYVDSIMRAIWWLILVYLCVSVMTDEARVRERVR